MLEEDATYERGRFHRLYGGVLWIEGAFDLATETFDP